jgi:hypothetical protein
MERRSMMNRHSKPALGIAVDDADDTGHHDVTFTAPKERPILMSAPMVRALLVGTKTQTRRIVKAKGCRAFPMPAHWGKEALETWAPHCPYGQPGDRLWVRETWWLDVSNQNGLTISRYATEDAPHHWRVPSPADLDRLKNKRLDQGRCRPSIHMPRWASRITLEITEVRVQRLQEISEEDCWAEGIEADCTQATPFLEYHELWESINGPGSWDLNPWVWAITFKRITP